MTGAGTWLSPASMDRRLRLMHGGPFFELQRRARLMTNEDFRTPIRTTIVITLTFLLPVIVAGLSPAGNLDAFLSDPGVWAKFLFAPLFFFMAEPSIERSVERCITTFSSILMITEDAWQSFDKSVTIALSRRGFGDC